MKRFLPLALLAVPIAFLSLAAGRPDKNSPSRAAGQLLDKMVEAHGGMELWESAGAVSFEHILHIPNGPWMVKHEVVEISGRRTYASWPLLDASVGFDGSETWSTRWPPQMMAPSATLYTGFVPVNLVWLSRDQGVTLEQPRRGTFPLQGETTEFDIVRMSYEGGDDYFDLFIDTETHLLRGIETIVTNRAMLDAIGLPAEATHWGPMVHRFRSYAEAGGLLFPEHWDTRMVEDGREIGQHLVLNHRLEPKFDESRVRRPSGAVVDRGASG